MAHEPILIAIESFLAETGMGVSYFGEKSVRNSKLVRRLRSGRPIQSDTEVRVRAFMTDEMAKWKAAKRLLRKSRDADLPQVASAHS